MKQLALTPLSPGTKTQVRVPGSKSYTNRALLLAALTDGSVNLLGPLVSDDTHAMMSCLRSLGIEISQVDDRITVHGYIGDIKPQSYVLDVNLSGTSLRFLLALACVIPGEQIIQGSEGLHKRPIGDLVAALRQVGADITYIGKEGFPPLRVGSSRLTSGTINLSGGESSQYLSAVLMIAPQIGELEVSLTDELNSRPYVDMTIAAMKAFGVDVTAETGRYSVGSGQQYHCTDYAIEGDASGAAYFFAIAALTSSTVTVNNITASSVQGDLAILGMLEQMGSSVVYNDDSITVRGVGVRPLSVAMEDCPDQAQTMAVLAAFAEGDSVISGVQSLRIKETERLQALQQELAKMGIKTDSTVDTLTVHGGTPEPAAIVTYDDHRMAMAFAVAGSHLSGMTIADPGVVTKSFPSFWNELASCGVGVTEILPNIVLIGMRDTGKTTVARLLAQRLGRNFVDVDEQLVATSGSSTAEIVQKHGWDYFRTQETASALRLSNMQNAVIATGGGIVTRPENMAALAQNSTIVYMRATVNTLAQRRFHDGKDRPSLTEEATPEAEITKVLAERSTAYTAAANLIIDTDNLMPEQIADQLALLAPLDLQPTRQHCVIIGDPVSHSLSPTMHMAGYNALQIEANFSFTACRVLLDQLHTFVGAMRSCTIRGASCTAPHKQGIIALLDMVEPVAAKIGAVNTVVNENGILTGYNTDWIGVVNALEEVRPLKGLQVSLIGAGGAGRAAAYGLNQAGAIVTIYNRTLSKAEALAQECGGIAKSLDDLSAIANADVIVNATSVGFIGSDESVLPASLFRPTQLVLDAVYTSEPTHFARDAAASGATVLDGRAMLLHQGIAQFAIFTGQPAPVEAMRTALYQPKETP